MLLRCITVNGRRGVGVHSTADDLTGWILSMLLWHLALLRTGPLMGVLLPPNLAC
jgi:hypothetical protein